jgi:hypothetical protein
MNQRCAILMVLLFAACTQEPPKPAQTPRVNLSGFPKGFQDGYRDGCTSSQSLITKKDQARYKSDDQYTTGWQDGYSACRNK